MIANWYLWKEALNECSRLWTASDWFQICRFPDDPDFCISGFPYFRVSTFPVYVSTCIWPCRAGWIEGLFEVVALKSQFSDPKWDLPSWFSDSRANFHLWTVVLPSYLFSSKRDTVSPILSFGVLAWDSKMTAYQQFLKHIYWNFMESGISGIGIWLNLWVSASNELGKPYFWQNLLEIDPLR